MKNRIIKSTQNDFMVSGKLPDLVESPQFISLFCWIRDPWQQNEQLHEMKLGNKNKKI
jgi:hypothetical protein